MGTACSLIKLISRLKQPYKCIVNYSCYTCQSSIILISAGIAMLYFFMNALHGENILYRGLAIAGIIGVSLGVALLFSAFSIFVFYHRLYKLYKNNLQQISEESHKRHEPYPDNQLTNESPSVVISSLDAQQNIFPYNPTFYPVAPSAPTAPPVPIETTERTNRVIPPTWTPVLPQPGIGAGSPSAIQGVSVQ